MGAPERSASIDDSLQTRSAAARQISLSRLTTPQVLKVHGGVMRIEINGHHHEVHHHSLTGAGIKALGHHEHGDLFRLEGDQRRPVSNEETIHLHDGERFLIESEPRHERIAIEVDGTRFETERHEMTGSAIKQLARRPPGNTLYRLEGRERVHVRDDETVHLHDCERFITLPPVGQAA
jgi:hypothetical protein